jgi:hypothetical protein
MCNLQDTCSIFNGNKMPMGNKLSFLAICFKNECAKFEKLVLKRNA